MVGFPPTHNKLKDLILEADNDEAAEMHNSEYIKSTGWITFSLCSATQHTESTVIYFIYQQSTICYQEQDGTAVPSCSW